MFLFFFSVPQAQLLLPTTILPLLLPFFLFIIVAIIFFLPDHYQILFLSSFFFLFLLRAVSSDIKFAWEVIQTTPLEEVGLDNTKQFKFSALFPLCC